MQHRLTGPARSYRSLNITLNVRLMQPLPAYDALGVPPQAGSGSRASRLASSLRPLKIEEMDRARVSTIRLRSLTRNPCAAGIGEAGRRPFRKLRGPRP